MVTRNKAAIIKIVTVIAVITGILTVSLTLPSFGVVQYDEWGLVKNNWTGEVDYTQVYEPGRYFIGLTSEFVTFPSDYRTIEFSDDYTAEDSPITGRTNDSIEVEFDFSFQYKLEKDDVPILMQTFGENFEYQFVQNARSVLRNVAGSHEAIDFVQDRPGIQQEMLTELNATFSNNLFSRVLITQLRRIQLDTNWLQAKADYQIALLEQNAALVRVQTEIMEAESQYNITLIEANASAQATIIAAQAEAEALNITLTQEGLSFAEFMTTMNFNSTEILTYMWIQAIEQHDESMLIIGEDAPIILTP